MNETAGRQGESNRYKNTIKVNFNSQEKYPKNSRSYLVSLRDHDTTMLKKYEAV